jgi:hypothetical protein
MLFLLLLGYVQNSTYKPYLFKKYILYLSK